MATNTEKIVVQVVVKGQKQLEDLSGKTSKATKGVGGLTKGFTKMAAGIGLAIAAFRQINQLIGGSIKTFSKFEFEMAKVKAITGATEKDFQKLTSTAQKLGRTTFFTATQVGELQVAFGKLGFTTREILDAQEATLMLATATQSDLGRAAVVAGAAVRGFGLDASETQRVVDVMAVAFTSSALDIEKWQTSMTKVAPIANAAGIEIESTAAVMGTLTDAGIEASIAGTSLRNIFLKMQDPTSELAKKIGFTVSSGEDLEKALVQLNASGLTNAEMMELVDLRQVAAFATMVNGADRIVDLTDALDDANGKAQEMADIMKNTLQGDILEAKSAWEGLEIAIFTGSNNISRWLRDAIDVWTFLLNKFADSLKTSEDVAIDIFSKRMGIAKTQFKELQELAEINADPDISQTLSESIRIAADDLEKDIERLKKQTNEAKETWDNAWTNAPVGFGTESYEETYNRLKRQTDASILALTDLRDEQQKQADYETQQIKDSELEADIAAEKKRRAKLKENQDELKEIEKANRDKQRLEKQDFKDSETNLKNALKEELNADKQNLIDGLITEEEYNTRVFEAEQAHLDMMRDLRNAYGLDVASINGKILDNDLKRISEAAKAELDRFKQDQEIKKSQVDLAVEAADAIITITTQNIDRRAEREKKLLEERKEAGLITQEEYEAGVERISRKAFQQKKKLALMEILVDTAAAVAKIKIQAAVLAATPIIGHAMAASALAQIPFVIASGLIQAAVINAQKYALGGLIEEFANGGMVQGKSHAQGGEKFAVGGRVVELEGGEAVINKRSTSMFRGQLSAMNAAGGGVKFADGGLLNQPSFSQQQFNALNQNQMVGAMGSSRKVVVVESDITDTQEAVSVIQSQATL